MPAHADDFVHPSDKAALEKLRAVPLFSSAVQAFMKFFPERVWHGLNMANKIRLSPRQLPELYRHLPPVCSRLGIDEPELYLEMNPFPNAYTYGDKKVFITLTSGLIDHLTETEVRAVIAHECGHIACQHVLYHTMASVFIRYGPVVFGPLSAVSLPLQYALLFWMRRSELSSDRAAAVAMGGAKPVVETMVRLAGGPKSITQNVDLALYAKQAEAYDKLMESDWDNFLIGTVAVHQQHPFHTVRTREIIRWCNTDHFKKVMRRLADAREPARCEECGHAFNGKRACVHCGKGHKPVRRRKAVAR
ncbi:MAG TPA: M48 family metallopeptidase [Planctomycetota bacterium]|nr:M48 family metallopeptidase [Planctomycetota bacterium]